MFSIYKLYLHKLENEIKKSSMPKHIALILDGNRRWANKNNTKFKHTHLRGANVVENLLEWCKDLKIKIVTLYVLSTENLYRENKELNGLYDLIKNRLEKLYLDPKIHMNKMRVRAFGRIELLPKSIKTILEKLDNATKDYDEYFINIALAYGGHDELIDATKKICHKIKNGVLDINDINKKEIESNLYTSHLPQSSPDMILRTSGEKRLSGFLIWQSAYSELIFIDVFWPEFRKIDLIKAIKIFQKRSRRLGK